jgi:hypothetical protein
MKTIKFLTSALLGCALWGCTDYLDVVPDNVATLEMAFNNRASAERYLITCYSYIPEYDNQTSYPGLTAGNETWYFTAHDNRTFSNRWAYYIALGFQNRQDPLTNYWDGGNGGQSLFQAIRDCNTFIEFVGSDMRVAGLSSAERMRWLAEVNVLKAYYHYFLFQLYGPIPIVDTNQPIDASPEEVWIVRRKVDDVVDYIVRLIDDNYLQLPPAILKEATELGRLTQAAALSIKAKSLLLAASPLFNGNEDYANFKDHDGLPFINQTSQIEKWKAAADAALAAIESAEANGHDLYDFSKGWNVPLPDELLLGLHVRGSVTMRENVERVWGIGPQASTNLQTLAQARLWPGMSTAADNILFGGSQSVWSATLSTAERFYSKNGVPIEEDKEWRDNDWYKNRYKTRQITNSDDRYNLREGRTTALLNFNREPRFYGSLAFDGSTWYGAGWKIPDDFNQQNWIRAMRGEFAGIVSTGYYNITGYFAKKVCHVENETSSSTWHVESYQFPIIRLADLYLMYAEALNEATESNTVNPDVYKYIDKVRARYKLPGVMAAWQASSVYPNKPNTPAGMQEIIRRERLIELALEGQHYFDIRRWKLATKEFGKLVQGWNVQGETPDEYYQVKTLYTPKIYQNKQYLWPIKESDLLVNPKLIQTYGW